MSKINVTVDITDQDVKDILWLLFGRLEFENPDSPTQRTLMRLRDYGMLEDRIAYLPPGLAHCFLVGKKQGGEDELLRYLKKMEDELTFADFLNT